MRFAWLTDVHLNFLPEDDLVAFLDSVADANVDAILLGGDIAEGDTLEHCLDLMAKRLGCPIYFVLGNHDFYFSSITATRQAVRSICHNYDNLHWLGESAPVTIAEGTALIGHDGWADGRNGDYLSSDVIMNDYFLIDELRDQDKQSLLPILQALADESANHFRSVLPEALASHRNVFLLTHVPPYREACWYQGQISSDNFLPHVSNRVVGETLNSIMANHPESQLTVLCGHTHGAGQVRVAPNILVRTGGATYGQPEIQDIVEL